MPTNFDARLGSSSRLETRTLMYTENKNHKLKISPFYVNNVYKLYKGKINYKKA